MSIRNGAVVLSFVIGSEGRGAVQTRSPSPSQSVRVVSHIRLTDGLPGMITLPSVADGATEPPRGVVVDLAELVGGVPGAEVVAQPRRTGFPALDSVCCWRLRPVRSTRES